MTLIDSLIESNNDFGIDLFRNISNNNQNAVISPISVFFGFFILYLGAKGSTASQIQQVLNINKLNKEKHGLSQGFQSLIEDLNSSDPQMYRLTIANLVGVQNGLKLLPEFENIIKDKLKAQIMSLDFKNNSKETKDIVNKWVEKQTNGQISKILDEPIDTNTLMIIMNAMHFKGNWKLQFNPANNEEKVFYNFGKTEKKIKSMKLKNKNFNFAINKELDINLLELEYVGNNLSLIIILPEKKDGLEELKNKINANNLKEIISEMKRTLLSVIQIPKFKTDESYDLKSIYQNRINVFSDAADLSDLTKARNLKVSKMKHKVIIEVNEKGTEASAVTLIEISPRSMIRHLSGLDFIADHPFLYVLRDIRSGLILFIGQITNF